MEIGLCPIQEFDVNLWSTLPNSQSRQEDRFKRFKGKFPNSLFTAPKGTPRGLPIASEHHLVLKDLEYSLEYDLESGSAMYR